MKGRDLLAYLSYLFEGDWDKIYQAIKAKKSVTNEEVDNFLKVNTYDYLTLIDDNYPMCLKGIARPPFVLFYKGDISLIDEEYEKNRLSIVGSRESSKYGADAISYLTNKLDKEIIVVSGLAKGIDKIAHEAALEANMKTIAIVANGLNKCYPKENEGLAEKIIKNGGLVLSEYPINVEATKDKFLIRNRLIAAFGHALLVGEAHKRSGTTRTVSYMLAMGKDVGCIPYPIDFNEKDSGCNKLIKDGAYLIENVDDIYNLLGRSKNF